MLYINLPLSCPSGLKFAVAKISTTRKNSYLILEQDFERFIKPYQIIQFYYHHCCCAYIRYCLTLRSIVGDRMMGKESYYDVNAH